MSLESKDATEQLRQVRLLRSRIESTLVFGPTLEHNEQEGSIFAVNTSSNFFNDEEYRDEFLQKTKKECDLLCESSKAVVTPIFQGIRDKCEDAHDYLSQLQEVATNNYQVVSKFALFVRTEHKIQILTMVKLLRRLDQCSNILELPRIVIEIKDTAKMTILEKSRIYTYMTETVRIKKAKLLQKFHKLFEEHLDAEISSSTDPRAEEGNSSTANDDDIYSGQKQIWRTFLQRSRQWLLAYAMVSILPSSIIKSSKMVVERFKEALDEAMTPLWGRFYHHLKMGLESYSRSQILWTFKYAASFIEMLHNLCGHITAADEMRLVYTASATAAGAPKSESIIDFHIVAKSQVLEKALKFLNAHVASIFVLVSPWEDIFGMQLVDEILEFDVWLSSYHPPSYLCHILYESKVFFHHWMLLEQSLIYRHFDPATTAANIVSNVGSSDGTNSNNNSNSRQASDTSLSPLEPDVAFSLKFSTPLNPASTSATSSSSSMLTKLSSTGNRFVTTEKTETLQCYSALYDSLQFFLLARQRYAYFPPAAQYLLAEVILEPLLCLSLGLCLYKIRCDPLLFPISMGQSSALLKDTRSSSTISFPMPDALVLYKDSVAYFQTALTTSDTEGSADRTDVTRHIATIAQESRCKKRWTIVQEWMPKLLLTSDLRRQGYALSNMAKTAMKVSDKYRNHQNFAYRNQWIEHLQQQPPSQPPQALSQAGFSSNELEACVVMTRGLAITMVDVIEEQWRTLYAKHLSKTSQPINKTQSGDESTLQSLLPSGQQHAQSQSSTISTESASAI